MAIYAGILGDTVNVYDDNANGDAVPIRTIHGPSTGLNGVANIVLDAAGNLYVGNAANSTITVYDPVANGDAVPIRIIGVAAPQDWVFQEVCQLIAQGISMFSTQGVFRRTEPSLFTAPASLAMSHLSAPSVEFRLPMET